MSTQSVAMPFWQKAVRDAPQAGQVALTMDVLAKQVFMLTLFKAAVYAGSINRT